jgi:hypothetical protein
MKYRVILVVFLVSVLFFLLFLRINLVKDSSRPDFFVGVDAVSDNVEDIKRLVDEVRSYTNLFVIGSTGITENITRLDEVCQYVYESGLYFMIYAHITEDFPQPQWIEDARQRWGARFLGLYAYDEAGGHQIDCARPFMLVEEANNYTDAANKFVGLLDEHLKHFTDYYIRAGEFPLFTADYGLYWFDYKAGYDVVLCEFGWNHSRLLNVALNRGAAKMQNKDWGVIITWTYRHQPYIESGDELYYDMVLAYLSGAKYVVVFNNPTEDSHYGTLTEEHFYAMKRFWHYIHTNPQRPGIYCPTCTQIAYVLPKDYGWGFRGYEDKVWGLWVDELSIKMGMDVDYLLHTHPLSLDIIYDDPEYYDNMRLYGKLFFWNGTVTTNENQS